MKGGGESGRFIPSFKRIMIELFPAESIPTSRIIISEGIRELEVLKGKQQVICFFDNKIEKESDWGCE